jgi:hypothetical protein
MFLSCAPSVVLYIEDSISMAVAVTDMGAASVNKCLGPKAPDACGAAVRMLLQ